MRRVILICGTSRSGSTMLDLILGGANGAASLGEAYRVFRSSKSHAAQIPVCRCGLPECPVWSELGSSSESEFHLRAFEVLGSSVLIDSSKSLCWAYDVISWARSSAAFEVACVLIWKQPSNHIASFEKRGLPPERALRYYYDYYRRALTLPAPKVAVQYEALTRDPGGVTSLLAKTLGLPFSESMLSFEDRVQHAVYGSTTTRAIGEQSIVPAPEVAREPLPRKLELLTGSLLGFDIRTSQELFKPRVATLRMPVWQLRCRVSRPLQLALARLSRHWPWLGTKAS